MPKKKKRGIFFPVTKKEKRKNNNTKRKCLEISLNTAASTEPHPTPRGEKRNLSSLSPEIAESSALRALNADFFGLISVTGAMARTSEKALIKKKKIEKKRKEINK